MCGPHFRCCNSLGLERTRCLPEEFDQRFHTQVRPSVPMRDPLLEQLCIGWTLRHGILDKGCAPIAAPLTVKFKIVKHQGRAEGKRIAALVGHTPAYVGSVN